ncbi:hypothetical protein Pla123a_06400 [Posidoniimonas polymericola]|uniref:DUF7668 domain-containing protein n=1 Tax=Posidoniimonas polymericola TaxID=2528002 RepID=A0A5C5ZH06_9BACT|nr:hypothetical protein [Posidoniimonas polymericola]TWT85833.1 hypothetical protein Pla123a_06400 [Posidoniimonas polymericola]
MSSIAKRPDLTATHKEIVQYAREWVCYAASHGLNAALNLLDRRDSEPPWSEEFVGTLSENHFGDGAKGVISDPSGHGDLRVEAYEFNDGSGFAVDHDLAMNGKRSDFTAQFEFIKSNSGFQIYLTDIHVL